jgi:hypothetical protein
MEQAAYVSDVMSFYLDNQLQETFTTLARQTNNLYELAYMFGYKPKATKASQVIIDLYQQVPANASGEPDFNYTLTVGENTVVTSKNNSLNTFLIEDKCDFSFSSSLDPTETSIYEVIGSSPAYFLLKKSRKSNFSNHYNRKFYIWGPFTISNYKYRRRKHNKSIRYYRFRWKCLERSRLFRPRNGF